MSLKAKTLNLIVAVGAGLALTSNAAAPGDNSLRPKTSAGACPAFPIRKATSQRRIGWSSARCCSRIYQLLRDCHGVNADGKGRAAKLYDPKPANLHVSPYNDTYKEMIIRCGGQRIARSEFMPPWGEELTDEQIRDVIAYLKSILTVSPPLQS